MTTLQHENNILRTLLLRKQKRHGLSIINKKEIIDQRNNDDELSSSMIRLLLDSFTTYYTLRSTLYNNVKRTQRQPNFPEDLSENLVRLYINTYERKECTWVNVSQGDLYVPKTDTRIEVKCVNSNGPISFGPSEVWNELYIIDVRELFTAQRNVKIYAIKQDNTTLLDLYVSKTQTYKDQIAQKRRPRCRLEQLQSFYNDDMKLVFHDKIDLLINSLQ